MSVGITVEVAGGRVNAGSEVVGCIGIPGGAVGATGNLQEDKREPNNMKITMLR